MSQYTVLCVDAEATVEELTAAVDANESLVPISRTTYDGAREALANESVDCVVTGYELPDATGLSLIDAVDEQVIHCPCVLVASVPPEEIETKGFDPLAVEYLSRESPDSLDRLGAVVEDLIVHNAHAEFLVPTDEAARLAALAAYDVADLPIEASFEQLTDLIASHFDVAVAFVGLIDRDTEQFVACTGADWESMSREDTICTHSMLQEEVMVIEDIKTDGRFTDIEALHRLGIVSYAGANMTTPEGRTIGQVCAIDHERRQYSAAERADLQRFADTAMELLELRQRLYDQRMGEAA